MKHLVYLHGFASSANGRKAQYLRPRLVDRPDVTFHAIEFSPTPRDFEYLTITGMINRLRQFILDRELTKVIVLGSSMGGLVGLHYAHRFGELRYGGVSQLLLLAPALTYLSGERVGLPLAAWQAQSVGQVFHYGFNQGVALRYDLEIDGRFYQTPPPPPAPITIVHGTADEVVPVAGSRAYAVRYPRQVQLIEVDAGHDLNGHLPQIWSLTAQILAIPQPPQTNRSQE